MLIAATVLGLSVYKTATLDEITQAHLAGALAAQEVVGEAANTARGVLVDALGPAGNPGARSYKCLTFDVMVEPPDRVGCRSFRLNIDGISIGRVDGTVCPRADGSWSEAAGARALVSRPEEHRWRDAILKKGASLYREPGLQSFESRFDWPDITVHLGGYVYREAQTFAYLRLPNGETVYTLKSDVSRPPR